MASSVPPEQLSLLSLMFPSFMPLFSLMGPLLGTSNFYVRLLCISGLVLLFGKYAWEYLVEMLETHFTSKIDVPYRDEAYEMVISWVCAQPFAQSARASIVKVDHKAQQRENDLTNKKPLHYSPCNGRSIFWHNGNIFMFARDRCHEKFGHVREEVTLYCLGRNPNALRELLDECRRHYMKLVENKTCVFEHEERSWKLSQSKSKRDTATVVIKKETKEMLLNDIAEFLKPDTRSWYRMRSLPYQRGYLFYGLPGTGKSSFSLSVAGQFNLDLYVLSISSLTDLSIKGLFSSLPQQCVVLLEDVDAVGLDRKKDLANETPDSDPKRIEKVSLSTLLNVLDGIGSSEGRILIMTTNHIERLDPALIRPGRADMRIEFHLADKNMINELFFFIYGGVKSCVNVDGEGSGDSANKDEKEKSSLYGDLNQLAQEFATKIPEWEFSPAEIMSYLVANKHSPRRAITGVDAWMKKNREEKKISSGTKTRVPDPNDESDHP